ncbi:MAG: helix-turn-helix domain-containing protein [Bacteroidota bacterium]
MMDAIEPRLPAADGPEPEWLRPSEVAALFRVSRQHIYRLIRRGDLAAVWVGGTPRIHRDEIARFVAEGGHRPGDDDLPAYAYRRRRRVTSHRKERGAGWAPR